MDCVWVFGLGRTPLVWAQAKSHPIINRVEIVKWSPKFLSRVSRLKSNKLGWIDPLIHSDESDFQTRDNKIIPKVYPYNNHFLPASSNVKQVLIQFINHNFRGVGKEEPVFSQFRILKIISSDELNQNWLKADKVNMPNGQLNLIIGTTNKPGKLFC